MCILQIIIMSELHSLKHWSCLHGQLTIIPSFMSVCFKDEVKLYTCSHDSDILAIDELRKPSYAKNEIDLIFNI